MASEQESVSEVAPDAPMQLTYRTRFFTGASMASESVFSLSSNTIAEIPILAARYDIAAWLHIPTVDSVIRSSLLLATPVFRTEEHITLRWVLFGMKMLVKCRSFFAIVT
jgi:hypothetical protein